MADEIERLTRIAVRYAKRKGASAAVYANASAFDVMTERKDRKMRDGSLRPGGICWFKFSTRDVYLSPRATALQLRSRMAKALT